jgi:hypothetical protein
MGPEQRKLDMVNALEALIQAKIDVGRVTSAMQHRNAHEALGKARQSVINMLDELPAREVVEDLVRKVDVKVSELKCQKPGCGGHCA